MSYEVQIRKAREGLYSARYKWTAHEKSQPFAAAKTREMLVKVCEQAGMKVVTRWS